MQKAQNRPASSHSPHVRRTLLIGCSAAVIMIGVCVGAYVGVSRFRYKVVGKVDRATGYQIEYTVSTRFRKTKDTGPRLPSNIIDGAAFDPVPPSTLQLWLRTHILGAKAASSHIGVEFDHPLRQDTIAGTAPQGTSIDAQGYVDISGISQLGVTVFHDRRIISGCPATWTAIDIPGSVGSTTSVHAYCLLIRPKGRPVTYAFVGMAETADEAHDVLIELTAIRDSIQIRKVR